MRGCFLTENSKSKFNEPITLVFNESSIETIDRTGEMKLNLSEIETIFETGQYYYLRLKTSDTLIIPKLKIENLDSLQIELQKLAKKLHIDFVHDLNWKWK